MPERPIEQTREEWRSVAHFHPFETYDGNAGRMVRCVGHRRASLPLASRNEAERWGQGSRRLADIGHTKPVSHITIERRIISDWVEDA